MTVSDYLKFWPQIEAVFVGQGVSITLPQAEAIAMELALLFNQNPTPPPPQPVPIQPPPPPPPPQNTPFTAEQITGFYLKYLGRPPENPDVVAMWMTHASAEQEIAGTPEAQAFAGSHGPHVTSLTGSGTQADPYVAMSSDPAQIDRDVDASMRGLGYPAGNDNSYWKALAHAVAPFSNGIWCHGWNAYWEARATPGNTGSADPNLGKQPAVHRA